MSFARTEELVNQMDVGCEHGLTPHPRPSLRRPKAPITTPEAQGIDQDSFKPGKL